MAATVNMHEAKTHLSKLVERAVDGEEVIIAKAGKPLVKLVPVEQPVLDTSKRLGGLEGRFVIPDDFKGFMREEIEEMFYGKD
jgi:prevent-host-death family protein